MNIFRYEFGVIKPKTEVIEVREVLICPKYWLPCEVRGSNWPFSKLNRRGLRVDYTQLVPEYIHALCVFNQVVNTLDRFRIQSLLVLWTSFLVFTLRGVVLKFQAYNLLAYLVSELFVLSRVPVPEGLRYFSKNLKGTTRETQEKLRGDDWQSRRVRPCELFYLIWFNR